MAELIIKKSKFISYVYDINHKDEIEAHISKLRVEHKKARHIVYAYIIENNQQIAGYDDDGEPSGTGGKAIYRMMLQRHDINKLVIVVRYFGGTKLGAGPLLRAYNKCALMALEESIQEDKK